MVEKMTVILDSAKCKLPRLDQSIRCPILNHSKLEPEIGFGLAGGGYGTYTYCPKCGTILSKNQEEENE